MAFETYRALIAELADRQGYDAAVLAAQIWQESRFNPVAVSPAGAGGIMQFMPGTWAWAQQQGWIPAGSRREDPAMCIQAGIRYMKWLLDRYKGAADPLALALAGYNAGQGNVDKAIQKAQRTDWEGLKAFLPAETQAYVPAILARVATYRAIYGATKAAVKVAIPGLGIGLIVLALAMLLRRLP
ncbi:MAG TPA: lytic transglycosylase domain-containing protein [Holophaga sp.]|nr:lytic transglycosylase domain-containing protein [Holophaga sp.]